MFKKGFFLLFFFALLGLFLSVQLGYWQKRGSEKVFIIQKGDNYSSIARKLEDEKIIYSERALRWYGRYLRPGAKLQRGEFGLYEGMSVPELFRVLSTGKPLEYKVTIPEGYNIFQIAELLESKGFGKKEQYLRLIRDPQLIEQLPQEFLLPTKPSSLEGFLFPDTYHLQKVHTEEEILGFFIRHFTQVWSSLQSQLRTATISVGKSMTAYEILILASIVEKETGAGFERPLIASVFENRLVKRMRLQTDPTVIYGRWVSQGSWDGNIRFKDLKENNPYNTYTNYGLPPGPIASPGKNAVLAVLNPAESDYLYFVSKNDGTHIFSKTYKDHSSAVQKTQLSPGAKEGKSWRDLPEDQKAR
ncbi:MAG: endolytic transglycosylase MltG [Oligoflexia bacterium]|nr:endolytic transglycosylase MltG [Oligoflexia bacterium]